MPRKPGSHLTYEERCHIYAYLKSGKSKREIARLMGCSHTTINGEIKRNQGKRGYRSKQAHVRATTRRTKASARTKITDETLTMIQKMLEETQSSPQQISGRLFKECAIKLSHESIYKIIWKDKKEGGDLYKNLRHKAKKYTKRSGKHAGRGLIPHRKDITERPPEAANKARFGDFELDTIVGAGRKGAIVSIVDRATKYTYLRFVPRATAQHVQKALCDSLDRLGKKNMVHTLTSDNGKEFACHERVAGTLGGAFYFATPYHSWERGLNEHTNGLVRQYFPKGTDFTRLSKKDVAQVAHKLNHRPRKILNFETPAEAFLRMTHLTPCGTFHS